MSDGDPAAPKDATAATRAANAAVAERLPLADRADFARAARGRIALPASPRVMHAAGFPVWNLDDYAFLDGEAPATVNPSLWRQAQLNRHAGLFEVAEGFYQVRGLDLANVSFVRGDTGWIVIDPLTSEETARAALELVRTRLGERPVHAVIYTHSHLDHFGGVRGVVDERDVAAGRVQVLAPEGFLEAAISENVIAGTVMARRSTYMYGMLLPRNPHGHVDAGLGKGLPLLATSGLIAPTEEIRASGEERTIDGVRMVFQLTPGTEAPAEMNLHFPERRILCMAENCTATLHNVYTPRGAQVRDALAWSKYVQQAIELFAGRSDAVFASHHWPRWGADDVRRFLEKQRDLYRWLHDQTMRRANRGQTMLEIAEELRLPESLGDEFFNRSYYGTVSHNVKAIYQRYLGWFDGNPANLHPLPPVEAGRRYVELAGGAEELLRKARASFATGDYRWTAQLVNHLVFAEPGNVDARRLQADALEQLGYQAESAPWRDFYLTGSQELRHGVPKLGRNAASGDVARAMTVEMLIDYLAVRLDGEAIGARRVELTLDVTDRGEVHAVGVQDGTLHHVPGRRADDPDAALSLTHAALVALALGSASLADLEARGELAVAGDREALETLLAALDAFSLGFPIVEP
ncbi:MAG: alkyl sulfatase dimerization domain-containing protein [Thermodesulfobacteriota bacterium]